MSTYLSLRNHNIIEEIYVRLNEAESSREKEYRAALKVQSWFRGSQLRKYIAYLNRQATVIQAAYRGYRGRRRYQQVVRNALNNMRWGSYNEAATRIQARWRGYYTRKYKHDFYARKKYLEAVKDRNEHVRDELAQYSEMIREEKERERRYLEEQEKMLQARRFHYMKSTYQINGVFASPWFPQNEFEKRLETVKPFSKEERKQFLKKKQNELINQSINQSIMSVGETRTVPNAWGQNKNTLDQNNYQNEKIINNDLPPIKNPPTSVNGVQGPFRPMNAVVKQRYRALSPSLRVGTPFDSEDQARLKERNKEWTRRIHENHLRPYGKPHLKYEQLLHTSSRYGHLDYGTKFFRREAEDKRLQTVVSPIPYFDKFGRTYTKGAVTLL